MISKENKKIRKLFIVTEYAALKVIDNFKISKINVKFEHQFIAPVLETSPLVSFMHDFITDIDCIH